MLLPGNPLKKNESLVAGKQACPTQLALSDSGGKGTDCK